MKIICTESKVLECFFLTGIKTVANLTIGERGSLYCSTDVMVETTELIYVGEVMANATSREVEFTWNPVFELLHNRQYTCRTSSKYGIQEQSVTLNVTGEFFRNIFNEILLCVLLQYRYHLLKYSSKTMALPWLEICISWSAMLQPLKVYCLPQLCGGSISQMVKSSRTV